MIYKGYTGVVEVDEEAGELFGTVLGIRDGITFVGKTVAEAEECFRRSVDFYLERCEANGKEPDRPFSGKFLLRVTPETHRGLAEMAHERKMSLNELVASTLDGLVGRGRVDPASEGRSTGAPAAKPPRKVVAPRKPGGRKPVS